jgi:hypothetical protein
MIFSCLSCIFHVNLCFYYRCFTWPAKWPCGLMIDFRTYPGPPSILLEGTSGVVLGDRNYWLPDLQAYLRTKGIVGASLPSAKRTPLKRQRTFAVF